MNDLQPRSQPPGQPAPGFDPQGASTAPPLTIDVPGAGLKRDYAGILEVPGR